MLAWHEKAFPKPILSPLPSRPETCACGLVHPVCADCDEPCWYYKHQPNGEEYHRFSPPSRPERAERLSDDEFDRAVQNLFDATGTVLRPRAHIVAAEGYRAREEAAAKDHEAKVARHERDLWIARAERAEAERDAYHEASLSALKEKDKAEADLAACQEEAARDVDLAGVAALQEADLAALQQRLDDSRSLQVGTATLLGEAQADLKAALTRVATLAGSFDHERILRGAAEAERAGLKADLAAAREALEKIATEDVPLGERGCAHGSDARKALAEWRENG